MLVTEGIANVETTFLAAVLAQNMLLRSTVASEAIVATMVFIAFLVAVCGTIGLVSVIWLFGSDGSAGSCDSRIFPMSHRQPP